MNDLLTLHCLILGDMPIEDGVFLIKISPTDGVDEMKSQLYHKRPDVLLSSEITIWKLHEYISFDDHLEESVKYLDVQNQADEMEVGDVISDYFREIPSKDHLHIIIEPVLLGRATRKRKETEVIDTEYRAHKLQRLASPTTMACQWSQDKDDPFFHNHRPMNAYGYPTELMHPIFGQFLDDCDQLQPTVEVYQFTHHLCAAMSHYHWDEDTRGTIFRNLFEKEPFGVKLHSKELHDSVADGIWCPAHDQDIAGMIVTYKQDAWPKGDPYIQSAGYYAQYLMHYHGAHQKAEAKDLNPGLPQQRLPCFLLALFGPYLSIMFAINGSTVVVDQHIGPLMLATPAHMIKKLACIFTALKRGLDRMKNYYSIPPSIDEQRHFPYPKSFTSFSGKETHFSYTTQPGGRPSIDDDFQRLLFLAELTTNQVDLGSPGRIFVKFVRRYPKDIHMECASKGIAPRLYGFESLPGGWFMVVMEAIGPSTIDDMEDQKLAEQRVREILTKLHALGYVHGDIRANNIVVRTSDQAAFFVDWDWAGIDGLVRYPFNPDLPRHSTAIGGCPILKEHDEYMVDNILFPK